MDYNDGNLLDAAVKITRGCAYSKAKVTKKFSKAKEIFS